MLDTNDALVDIPQSDIEAFEVNDIINGGSETGSVTFRRDFNNIGQLAYGYTVLVWFWRSTDDPTITAIIPPFEDGSEPYYIGHVVDIDQKMFATTGTVEVKLEGEFKLLDRAIVTESINPGLGVNPTLDAKVYLPHLINKYQPPNFGTPTIPSTMFLLKANTFDAAKLGAAIDTVTKQGRDTSGALFTWAVRCTYNYSYQTSGTDGNKLKRFVTVQADQNPNVIPTANFKNVFVRGQAKDYGVLTVGKDIVNVVAIYGGKNPTNGHTAYGSFSDSASVALFGAIEDKLSVDYLRSHDACAAYADVYFDLNAYPQGQGTFILLDPDNTVVAGSWIQAWEEATDDVTTTAKKQVRATTVKVTLKNERIEQMVGTVSPAPYLDKAIYRMGTHVNGVTASSIKRLGINTQQFFTRSGGAVTAQASNSVTLSAVDSVFGGTEISAAGATLTLTADQAYTIVHDSSSGIIAVVGDVPLSVTQIPLAHVITVGTTVYSEDRRFLSVTISAVNGRIRHDGSVDIAIEDLSDVQVTSVANNDVLTWDSIASKWENKPSGGLPVVDSLNGETGAVTLTAAGGVTITEDTSTDILIFSQAFLPLANGDLPGPSLIADPSGQTIGVPLF